MWRQQLQRPLPLPALPPHWMEQPALESVLPLRGMNRSRQTSRLNPVGDVASLLDTASTKNAWMPFLTAISMLVLSSSNRTTYTMEKETGRGGM